MAVGEVVGEMGVEGEGDWELVALEEMVWEGVAMRTK